MHSGVSFLAWKRFVSFCCFVFHKWKERDSRSSNKNCLDFCSRRSWGCCLLQSSGESFSAKVFWNRLNVSRSWVVWNVSLHKVVSCYWYYPFADGGFFFLSVYYKAYLQSPLGKGWTVQSARAQLVRWTLWILCNSAILFWKSFFGGDSRETRETEFDLDVLVVRRGSRCRRGLLDIDGSSGWSKGCWGKTSLRRASLRVGNCDGGILGLSMRCERLF